MKVARILLSFISVYASSTRIYIPYGRSTSEEPRMISHVPECSMHVIETLEVLKDTYFCKTEVALVDLSIFWEDFFHEDKGQIKVVIKTIKEDISTTAQFNMFKSNFLQEDLRHFNSIYCRVPHRDDDRRTGKIAKTNNVFVMPYYPDKSLAGRQIPPEGSAIVNDPSLLKLMVIRIISALNFMHVRDILHRNIDPSHILQDGNSFFLTGFGSSHHTVQNFGSPKSHAIVSTFDESHCREEDWAQLAYTLYVIACDARPRKYIDIVNLFKEGIYDPKVDRDLIEVLQYMSNKKHVEALKFREMDYFQGDQLQEFRWYLYDDVEEIAYQKWNHDKLGIPYGRLYYNY